MQLIKYANKTNRLDNVIDRFFNESLSFDDNFYSSLNFRNFCNQIFQDKENHYLLELDIPGIKKENISVSLCGNCVTIEYFDERKDGKEKSRQTYSIPCDSEGQNVTAHYSNGVLSIRIDRKLPTTKRIEIS